MQMGGMDSLVSINIEVGQLFMACNKIIGQSPKKGLR